jgi:hypothetical protein
MSRAPCWPGEPGWPQFRQVVGTPAWGAESCHKSPPPDSWNLSRTWVWLAGIYAQPAPNGAAGIWLAPYGAVALLEYAVGSWVAKGANIMAVVVVGGGCRTAWAWAGLATDRQDSSPHPSSPLPARAHDWHRVFSHGASLGIAICRRHLQATGPSVFSVVPSCAQGLFRSRRRRNCGHQCLLG